MKKLMSIDGKLWHGSAIDTGRLTQQYGGVKRRGWQWNLVFRTEVFGIEFEFGIEPDTEKVHYLPQ